MTADTKRRCKVMASDVRAGLSAYPGSKSIHPENYGLASNESVLAELRSILPGVRVERTGGLGYLRFTKEATGDSMD